MEQHATSSEASGRRVLVVHGAGREHGLSARLVAEVVGELERRGAEYRLQDLLADGFDPGDSTFTTLDGEIEDPFGGDLTPGPMLVRIEPETVFDGDAESEQEFYAVFAGLGAGETIEVRVEGIGTDIDGEVVGFEIDVKVRD